MTKLPGKKTPTPKLKRIDLRKGDGHEHPDIKIGKTRYLAKIGNDFWCGTFNRQWYGLNFHGWYGRSLQYDKPGTNSSSWTDLWELT
jgi:hypothetical protein